MKKYSEESQVIDFEQLPGGEEFVYNLFEDEFEEYCDERNSEGWGASREAHWDSFVDDIIDRVLIRQLYKYVKESEGKEFYNYRLEKVMSIYNTL